MSAAGATRGEFDYALALRFPGTLRVGPKLNLETFFDEVPAALVAHELMHLLHLTGTATGFRSYAVSLRLLRAQIERIREDVVDEVLAAPTGLYRWKHDVREPTEASTAVNAALINHLFLDGLIPMPDLPSEGPDNGRSPFPEHMPVTTEYANRFLLAHMKQDPLDGTEHRRPLYTPAQSWDFCYALGYRHLTEWAAGVVERMQRRYARESYDVVPFGARFFPSTSYRDRARHLTRPEHAVDDAVAAVVLGFERDSFGIETSLTLVDTALMLDPLVAPKSLIPGALTEPYNPWPVFFKLLTLAVEYQDALPRFHEDMDIQLIVEYQNALLELLGLNTTMRSLTEALAASVDILFDGITEGLPEFPADAHRETFRRVLDFRIRRLNGGAYFEDALTSKAKLTRFADQLAPALEVGLVSRSSRPKSHGLDVDLQIENFAHMRDVISAVVTGDGACPLKGPLRSCAAPEHSLCDQMASHDGEVRCLRAQTIERLKGAIGARAVEWKDVPPPRFRYV